MRTATMSKFRITKLKGFDIYRIEEQGRNEGTWVCVNNREYLCLPVAQDRLYELQARRAGEWETVDE